MRMETLDVASSHVLTELDIAEMYTQQAVATLDRGLFFNAILAYSRTAEMTKHPEIKALVYYNRGTHFPESNCGISSSTIALS